MVGWAAANIVEKNSKNPHDISLALESNKFVETPDAALARLTESYAAAMEAISGMHKVSRLLCKIWVDNNTTKPVYDDDGCVDPTQLSQNGNMRIMIQRASRAARKIIEGSIFSDPMVQPFIAKLVKVLVKENIMKSEGGDRLVLHTPYLLSVAQEKTLKRIIYLTLINYADTLHSVCTCGFHRPKSDNLKSVHQSILMRDIVRSLPHFTQSPYNNEPCIWHEPEEITKRLVLISYCQAADLDGSDPMIWLRVASSAHRFSVEAISNLNLDQSLMRFKRLERFALERGLISLPPQVPVNRCLAHAHTEHFKYLHRATFIELGKSDSDKMENVVFELNLTSYSWAALGRLLIRTCKEGGGLKEFQHADQSVDHQQLRYMHLLGAPKLKIYLAPILTMPQQVFGRIFDYLADRDGYGSDIKSLECTCRALAAAIISTRACRQHMKQCRLRRMENELRKDLIQDDSIDEIDNSMKNLSASTKEDPQQSHRISQRLRSQLTAQENSKGLSLRDALTEVIAALSEDHPEYLVNVEISKSVEWNSLCPYSSEVERSFHSWLVNCGSRRPEESHDLHPFENVIHERSLDLVNFVSVLNSRNSGPYDALRHFLTHISLNVCDVFQSTDEGGRIILSKCLLDCFDFLLNNHVHPPPDHDERFPVKFAWENNHWIESFSLNLLHGELRLRNNERFIAAYCEDFATLKTIVQSIEDIKRIGNSEYQGLGKIEQYLVVRSHWLLSCFYLWLSKAPINYFDVQESESIVSHIIEKIIAFLATTKENTMLTPHLAGPGRIGAHWSKLSDITLKTLRDEIHLNSILSRCRHRFQSHISDCKSNTDPVIDEDLLERYGLESNDVFGRNHREMINDFLSIYWEYLNDDSCQRFVSTDHRRWPVIWDLISDTSASKSNKDGQEGPALLTIVFHHLASKEESEKRILCVCVALAVECIIQIDELLHEVSSTSALKRLDSPYDSGGYINDEDSLEDETERTRYSQLLSGAKFFMAKALHITRCSKFRSDAVTCFTENGGLSWLIRNVFKNTTMELINLCVDEDVIEITLQFVSACVSVLSENLRQRSVFCVFLWTCRFVVVEHEYLKRQGPNYTDSLLSKRLNIVSVVLAEIVMLVLQKESRGFDALIPSRSLLTTTSKATSLTLLLALLDSCTFIWNTVLSLSSESYSARLKAHLRSALSHIRSPIASLMTSVCATICINHMYNYLNTSLGENNEYTLLNGSECDVKGLKDSIGSTNIACNGTLRIVSAVVQLIGLVVNNVDDKDALENFDVILYPGCKSAFLPSVVVRVLVILSDFVLHSLTFNGKWSVEYPSDFQSTGLQIDTFLCKMYRLLYGVHLVPHVSQCQSNKNVQLPSFNAASSSSTLTLPKSVEAVIQMYRCIARIYRPGTGRRYPPRNALECILQSLPLEDSKKSKAIRSFMWNKTDFDGEILCRAETSSNLFSFDEEKLLLELPPDFPAWTVALNSDKTDSQLTVVDEIELVRTGCLDFLAKGPAPGYFNNNTDIDHDRQETSQVETTLSQKINELVDLICLRPGSYHHWFQAGLCLSKKADLVNDRLPPLRSRLLKEHDFDVSLRKVARVKPYLPLNDLLVSQFNEFKTINRLTVFGYDFSLFVNTSWADFDSLYLSTQSATMVGAEESRVILEVNAMYEQEKYSDWQQFLGRLLVAVLQRLSRRFLYMALALHSRTSLRTDEDDDLCEDIAEALGINYYNNLMGSVSHGYPASELTLFEKRFLAKRAIICFKQVISNRRSRGDGLCWDLHFMIGKCFEKIATTLTDEHYFANEDSQTRRTEACRAYEVFMKRSIQNYSLSVCEAKKDSWVLEKCDGGGGSSHGLWEVIYRLNASRFKALLRYAQASPETCLSAEVEALRIVDESWYDEIAKNSDTSVQGGNGRLRSIFRDILTGLAQCRIQNPYFHRSVYRHAQALMWAKIFLGNIDGDSWNMLGMNCEKSCAENAKQILEVLFDKKRSQICAVWLTTPARPNAFEFLNSFSQKFDYLRWKYCMGYVDCLRLCKDINSLQTIMNWIDAAPRDLPSFYDKSAGTRGSTCRMIHHKENLLCQGIGIIFNLSRYVNGAIAEVCVQLLHDLTSKSRESSIVDEQRELLYKAYTCFRRLNCPIDNDTWKSLSIRKKLEDSKIPEVEALCECYVFMEDAESPKYSHSLLSVDAKMQLLRNAVVYCDSAFTSRVDQDTVHKRKRLKRKISDTYS